MDNIREFITKNLFKIILWSIIAVLLFFVIKHRSRIKKFLLEVKAELTKVSWSTPKELLGATWIVIATTSILAIFIGIGDFILSKFLHIIIR